MHKTIRVFAMAGLSAIAGLAISAGPAQAADTVGQPGAKAATEKSVKAQPHRNRERIAGYYQSRRSCEFAGRIGERFNKWDDYDCEFVRFGFRRGAWALEVEQDWRWNRFNDHRGPWGHRGR